MEGCTVARRVRIVEGNLNDYAKLARYHYRGSNLTAYANIFAMRLGQETIGVIVYTMPNWGLELRNSATDYFFCGFDSRTRMSLINKNIRCIGRVIIEPRFRGLSLASRLVRETMGKVNVAIIEAVAVMGLINPFFEKAGMRAYRAGMPARCVRLIEALSVVGIEEAELLDAKVVQRKIKKLNGKEGRFIEGEMRVFLQSYGKQRDMAATVERTEFIVSKLTARPVYYIWFNKELGLVI